MKSAKKFLGLGVVVSINLVLQFLFQWYIIVSLGVGSASDAFFGAMALPQFILLVLSSSLTVVLIPMIAPFKAGEFQKESWNYFQGAGLLFGLIALLLFATAHWWVGWILPGFKGENFTLVLHLSQIQLFTMVLSAMLSVLWAVHSARENFYLIESTSIIANLLAFAALYFALRYYGIYAAAWINVLRVALQLAFLMKILGPYQKPVWASTSFREAWKKLRPLIAGNIYFKTDTLVDRHLTSTGNGGDLTLLNLAQQLYAAGNSILSKVLVSTMVPPMARAHAEGRTAHFNQLFKRRLLVGSAVTVLGLVVLLAIGKWLLAVFFSVKNFDAAAVSRLWWLLVLLGGYWIGALTGSITAATFYAKGNTRTPTRLSMLNFTLYLPLKFFCYYRFGIQGLALSVSIYYISSFLLQLYYLRRNLL
jgi:putative peptidoglycan lipid II flippase